MKNAIEIKYDVTTLPKNGQRVRYQNMDGEIKEGHYYSDDLVFVTADDFFDFVCNVDFWEPLEEEK